jgi:hypothetical protein
MLFQSYENVELSDTKYCDIYLQAISSSMYKHQKQALHWMIQRENGNQLPPFWENKDGQYFNSVTIFTTKTKPKSVFGGSHIFLHHATENTVAIVLLFKQLSRIFLSSLKNIIYF